MNKGKEGPRYQYPNSLISPPRHHICVPTSIPSIRRLSKNDVNPYNETQRVGTRFHDNLVKDRKDEDKPGPKNKS